MYWPVAVEISFKDISIFNSCGHFLSNVGRGHHYKHLYKFIVNLDQWFRRKCRLKMLI